MVKLSDISFDAAKTLTGPHSKFVGVSEKTTYIGAFCDNVLVGMVGFRMVQGGAIEFCSAIVLPRFRGRGIYRALCEKRLRRIDQLGKTKIVAYCTRYSLNAFLKQGFKIVRQYKNSTKVEKHV